MFNFSYNISDNLLDSLNKADSLRRNILLTPLFYKSEVQLRFRSLVNRIYSTMTLSGFLITKASVEKTLSLYHEKVSGNEQLIKNHKNIFDLTAWNWLANPNPIAAYDVVNLSTVCFSKKNIKDSEDLQNLLNYIQSSNDHPVVKAALAQIGLISILPYNQENNDLSRIFSYLVLYKYGYDIRRMLAVEEVFLDDINLYRQNIETGLNNSTQTLWIEYYAKCFLTQLRKIAKRISDANESMAEPDLLKLNSRQLEIINLLDNPKKSLTTSIVKNLFHVSKVTAARDLIKLTGLGLLFTHGKGRSVYYTKA